MKKLLFIDRDGTIIVEPKDTEQVDSLERLDFNPGVIVNLHKICQETDFDLVMVTNQDGLGTPSFPEDIFWPAHNKMLSIMEREGILFKEVLIDKTFPEEQAPTRKPGTGMLGEYMKGEYDLSGSLVIGDRVTDVELARNLGAKGIFLKNDSESINWSKNGLQETLVLEAANWEAIYQFLTTEGRAIKHSRDTNETSILIELNLDGSGKAEIQTGLGFFDHMLEQVAKHSGINLMVKAEGDLHIDEHHTIEDTGITLGESFLKALGDKRGIERYGYCLPMDDCLAQVALDFGGRNWIEWEVDFKREKIGEMPTEMFFHFFKSFSDAAKCNLNIKAEGQNEHHKIEAIFKAFAKSIKMAITRDLRSRELPTTKGVW
ncbi:MAG: bifunctional histidinol-phosphatase/imidazoleglycerol-phosphate dehydratase HisB [Bacteroidetes bacterium]|nr:bifunctional histidinol-phosphatase/imidazoleglycerol-phosphate dehydratase HisB [Bacteroidota bacterium]